VNCNNKFIFNFLFFREQINISLAFFDKDIQVFLIFKYSQITLLASEKIKKKPLPLEVFCVIKKTMEAF
jgi:hypothetical protein